MKSPLRPVCAPRLRAFTLIELLTVILILSILVAVLVVGLGDAQKAAKSQATLQLLTKLETVVKQYQTEFGSCPSSSFQAGQEVANDGENVGIEALVVALWSNKYEAGGLLEDLRDKLINTDEDSSPRQLTDFGTRALLEIPDTWENPIAYIERADYGVSSRRYRTIDVDTQEEVEGLPVAYKNPKTGQYYMPQSFQLVSAGPDGRFGTEDDLTNFERTP